MYDALIGDTSTNADVYSNAMTRTRANQITCINIRSLLVYFYGHIVCAKERLQNIDSVNEK